MALAAFGPVMLIERQLVFAAIKQTGVGRMAETATATDLRNARRTGSVSAKTAKLAVFHFSLLSVPRIWQDALLTEFDPMEPGEPENGKRFFPSGAIFFFALLIVFYAALWLVIYWIMVARA